MRLDELVRPPNAICSGLRWQGRFLSLRRLTLAPSTKVWELQSQCSRLPLGGDHPLIVELGDAPWHLRDLRWDRARRLSQPGARWYRKRGAPPYLAVRF